MSREYQLGELLVLETGSRQYQIGETLVSETAAAVTYTAAVGLTSQSSTLTATTTFSAGTHTASISLLTNTSILSASATFSPGTHTAAVGLTSNPSTLSTSSTFSPGIKTAVVALVGGSGSLSASAAHVRPTYTASVALVGNSSALAASGIFATVSFIATIGLVSNSSVLAASSTFVPPPVTTAVALTSSSSLLSGTTSFIPVGGPDPTVPTLNVTASGGIATAHIEDSMPGSVNVIYVSYIQDPTWVEAGTRVGDGDVVLTVPGWGRFFAYARSTLSSKSVTSLVVAFYLDNPDNIATLDHTPAEIVQKLLIDRSAATEPEGTSAWPVFVSVLPARPENTLTCNDTVGRTHGRLAPSGKVPQHRGVQILLRSGSPSLGFVKLNDIAEMLTREVLRETVIVDDTTYLVHSISQVGTVLSLGRESTLSDNRGSISDCQLFSLNLLVSVKQVA